MASVLAVDLALVRDVLLPGLRLTPGRAVAARVLEAPVGGRGSLSIAGYALGAELPEGLRAGEELRLVVRDVDAQRVLLAIEHAPAGTAETASPAAAHVAPPPPIPLPGDVRVRVLPDEEGSGSGSDRGRPDAGATLAIGFEGPGLGAVQLRFALTAGELSVSVTLAPGEPLRRGAAAAGALRDELTAAGDGRAVSLTITPRRDPLDVYA